jgi:S1-C subfamily serine protease
VEPGTSIETALKSQVPFVIVYEDAPAIQESLKGPITSFNGIKTTNIEELRNAIGGAAPHQVVTIITKSEGKAKAE